MQHSSQVQCSPDSARQEHSAPSGGHQRALAGISHTQAHEHVSLHPIWIRRRPHEASVPCGAGKPTSIGGSQSQSLRRAKASGVSPPSMEEPGGEVCAQIAFRHPRSARRSEDHHLLARATREEAGSRHGAATRRARRSHILDQPRVRHTLKVRATLRAPLQPRWFVTRYHGCFAVSSVTSVKRGLFQGLKH